MAKLSYRMQQVLDEAPLDWQPCGSIGHGRSNLTLRGLEHRGLIELRIDAELEWQWRRAPAA